MLLNPEIVEASRNEKGREGCMSVPDLTGDVKRATKITVAGQLPLSGERVLITTDAFEARALQHEIDHCDGQLFLDRVVSAHALHARKSISSRVTPAAPDTGRSRPNRSLGIVSQASASRCGARASPTAARQPSSALRHAITGVCGGGR